jgi:hypothetical protein
VENDVKMKLLMPNEGCAMTLEVRTRVKGGKAKLDIYFILIHTVRKLGKIILKLCTLVNDCS